MYEKRLHRRLQIEELEPRIAPASVVWVDDDYSHSTPGWGVDHFDSLPPALLAVKAGGTINVAPGLYPVSATIVIDKPVNILGPQKNVHPVIYANTASAGTVARTPGDIATEAVFDGGGTVATLFRLQANRIVLNGLDIRNGTGDLLECAPIAPLKDVSVRIMYNFIHGTANGEGIRVQNRSYVKILCNEIYDTKSGINVSGSINTWINSNYIHDVQTDAIILGNTSGGDAKATGGQIQRNVVGNVGGSGAKIFTSNVVMGNNAVGYLLNKDPNGLVIGQTSGDITGTNGAVYVSFPVSRVTVQANTLGNYTACGIRIGNQYSTPRSITVQRNVLEGTAQDVWSSLCTIGSVTVYDVDGTRAYGTYTGPGYAELFLDSPVPGRWAIEEVVMHGTTQDTSFTLRSSGGLTPGIAVGNITVHKALSATGALLKLDLSGVNLVDNGVILADGSVGSMAVRDTGASAMIEIAGSLGKFSGRSLGPGFALVVHGDLGPFSAKALGQGSSIAVDGGIAALTVNGPVVYSAISAAGTAGIGPMNIKGSIGMTLNSAGPLKTLTVSGSSTPPAVLGGIIQVQSIEAINAPNANLDSLVIRAPNGIGKINALNMKDVLVSANTIGSITVSKNIAGSSNSMLILAGYDIGQDLVFGTMDDGAYTTGASIGTIKVGGTMSGASIAVNVSPGNNGWFGDNDDDVLNSNVTGVIQSAVFAKPPQGSTVAGQHYGVVAQQINKVTIAGKTVSLPWTSGNFTIKQVVYITKISPLCL